MSSSLAVIKPQTIFMERLRRDIGENEPLSHLSYANVPRQLVGLSPVSNLHFMQSRSKTGKDDAVSLYQLDSRNIIGPAQEPKRLKRKPFVITIPNSQGRDWHYSGHLADPSFVAEFGEHNADIICSILSSFRNDNHRKLDLHRSDLMMSTAVSAIAVRQTPFSLDKIDGHHYRN